MDKTYQASTRQFAGSIAQIEIAWGKWWCRLGLPMAFLIDGNKIEAYSIDKICTESWIWQYIQDFSLPYILTYVNIMGCDKDQLHIGMMNKFKYLCSITRLRATN